MEERTPTVLIEISVSGDVDLLDLALEDDEDPEEPEELEEKLAGMSHYVVKNIDGFFGVYTGFDADDEEDIRESARDRDLIVFQDSSVFWGDGESLIDGNGELIDEDSFSAEAELSGTEVLE